MNMQKKATHFILGLHNHQPVGNFPEVIETNYQQAYLPFLEVLGRYPGIKVTMHYSGILLDWINGNHPEFIDKLRGMVQNGQVEMMGGGFFEPIMPIIPDEDKLGQIKMLTQRVQELLGTTPRGMWLAERIWEPHLARPIAQAGLQYITIDDAHFHQIGKKDNLQYYLTEEEGWELKIFPISEKLRYLVPFRPVQEVLDFFRSCHSDEEDRLMVLADDGEKFGAWPETYDSVYQQGWLEEFFQMLEANREWLRTVTFSEYMSSHPPQGPVYLPTASYREMNEWSGGFWRNFLSRYPESNRMHKKMLAVRRRLAMVDSEQVRDNALRFLWAGQCNCAYWHGIFGGLYLNFLRSALWENLLMAEEETEKALHRQEQWLDVRVEDRDFDGQKEIVLVSDRFSLLFAPHLGGSMWELSWRPARVNLLDTLTRRPESYHQDLVEQAEAPSPSGEPAPEQCTPSIHDRKLTGGEDLARYLHYDPYPRGAFIEHIFPHEGVSLEDFASGSSPEEPEFLLKPVTVEIKRFGERQAHEEAAIIFRRRAPAYGADMVLQKEITVQPGSDQIKVAYHLENKSESTFKCRFGVEFNLALLSGSDRERYYTIPGRDLAEAHLASTGTEEEVEAVTLVDRPRGLQVTLNFVRPALLWRFPIETVCRSEEGVGKVYQHSLVMPQWPVELAGGESLDLEIYLDLSGVSDENRQEPAGEEREETAWTHGLYT